MKILIISLILILFFIYISLIYIVVRMRSAAKFNEIQFLKMLRQLRYGQLNVNLSTFRNENIKTASAKLLEALQDREKMLSEYKQILIEKNKSLEKMIELEKESQKFKDDFVAALTHDLKTPVIAEVNAIKMLLSGNFGEINSSQKEVLEMMLKSDKDLIELSEMLLQTYKFQQAEVELNKSKVDVAVFVKEIFDEISPLFHPKNQTPIADIQVKNLFSCIDTIHFKRVVHNLLLNASKYGYNDTSIILKIYRDNDKICIQIINEGDTINPEDAKLIFQKYYSGIKKFSQLGTGLGLYCANKIVCAHNGAIDVSSIDNKTIFTVCLPIIE